MKLHRIIVFSVAGLVATIGLVGCTAAPTSQPTPTPEPTPSPSLTITSPEDGATLPAGDVTVSVRVSNFTVVDELGGENVPGKGHLHYYLDADPPTTPGEPAVSASGTYAATAETSHTWQNVEPGSHTFSVQLVNNNHTPLEPAVVDSITVTVAAEPSESVTIDLSAENIAFDKSQITVPAGAMVTIVFNNKDSIQHNFALYETSAATTSIFVGEIIRGPQTIEYTFVAPAVPGDYFFRCDVHPAVMKGTFTVE